MRINIFSVCKPLLTANNFYLRNYRNFKIYKDFLNILYVFLLLLLCKIKRKHATALFLALLTGSFLGNI